MAMALSRVDWTEAALAALAQEGLGAVAVEPLARRLGTTKGSFYWHFADRADLITATLELWEQRETAEVISDIEAIGDRGERLTALGRVAIAGAAYGSPHAGVLAARSHPLVAPVLERVTRTRLAFVARLYRDLGLTPDEAERHARLAYAIYLGVGDLRSLAVATGLHGEEVERLVDLSDRTLRLGVGVALRDPPADDEPAGRRALGR